MDYEAKWYWIHKELMKMRYERPKLYALILQYLSDERLDEVKRSDKFEKIDEETDPLGLCRRNTQSQFMRQ